MVTQATTITITSDDPARLDDYNAYRNDDLTVIVTFTDDAGAPLNIAAGAWSARALLSDGSGGWSTNPLIAWDLNHSSDLAHGQLGLYLTRAMLELIEQPAFLFDVKDTSDLFGRTVVCGRIQLSDVR